MKTHGLVNLQTNICENVVVLDSADQYTVPDGYVLVVGGAIGWTWTGDAWTEPEVVWPRDLKIGQARFIRNRLLKRYIDTFNPLRWAALTEQQQQAWSAYRQSLLDITDQPGFPDVIDWPNPPDQNQ
jgi:hypothetical protein